ncbi:MAG: RBBP9/YdeN family alpha/beta hydrolase [Sphingomonadaceae bacterium]
MAEAHFSGRGNTPLVLTVPGLNGSGATHWQSIWEANRGDCERVELGMWGTPHRNAWVTKLDHAIKRAPGPVILAAHSLGCLAVAWWAALEGQGYGWPVAGALLVAPPDCDRAEVPRALTGFGPAPKVSLPFPSIVVASRDDQYATLDRQYGMAKFWGSHFVDVGTLGHINAESNIGAWLFGQRLLDRLIAAANDRARRAPADRASAGPWSLYPPPAGSGGEMGEPGI